MSALERIAIGVLSATLLGYLGTIGHRYFIQKNAFDFELLFLVFVFILRTKIGLDDIHYYREEAKQTTHVKHAVLTSLLSYLMWFFIPFQVFHNFELGILLSSWTILMSTASIAFTGIGLEKALKQTKGKLSDAATTYSVLKRFYDEQPYWIITNCVYESLLLVLVYFYPVPNAAFIFVVSLLIIISIYDAYRSDSLGYITGTKKTGFPVFCSNTQCQHFLGNSQMFDEFCPKCGSKANVIQSD